MRDRDVVQGNWWGVCVCLPMWCVRVCVCVCGAMPCVYVCVRERCVWEMCDGRSKSPGREHKSVEWRLTSGGDGGGGGGNSGRRCACVLGYADGAGKGKGRKEGRGGRDVGLRAVTTKTQSGDETGAVVVAAARADYDSTLLRRGVTQNPGNAGAGGAGTTRSSVGGGSGCGRRSSGSDKGSSGSGCCNEPKKPEGECGSLVRETTVYARRPGEYGPGGEGG